MWRVDVELDVEVEVEVHVEVEVDVEVEAEVKVEVEVIHFKTALNVVFQIACLFSLFSNTELKLSQTQFSTILLLYFMLYFM